MSLTFKMMRKQPDCIIHSVSSYKAFVIEYFNKFKITVSVKKIPDIVFIFHF